MDAAFEAFGLPVRTPANKVTALADAIEILRGIWCCPPLLMGTVASRWLGVWCEAGGGHGVGGGGRGVGYSAVTSVTAARAEDSSTMALFWA